MPTSIQFDEPCFNIYLDEVEAWGIEALEQCMDGVRARKAVHICYGYGTPAVLAWKTKNTDWGHYGVTLPLLAKSQRRSGVGRVRRRRVWTCRCWGSWAARTSCSASIDVGTEDVETPEVVAGRIRRALAYVPASQLLSVYRLRPGAAQPRGRSG